jgi:hypothetical protein
MTAKAVFNFAQKWGTLGNWPGSLQPHEARIIMGQCAKLPRNSTLVDLGFDGGRTTIALGWIAQMSGAHVLALGPEIPQIDSERWFFKLIALFDLRRIVKREIECDPFAVDVVVVSPMVIEIAKEWVHAVKPGGLLIFVRPQVEPKVDGFETLVDKDGVFVLRRDVVVESSDAVVASDIGMEEAEVIE